MSLQVMSLQVPENNKNKKIEPKWDSYRQYFFSYNISFDIISENKDLELKYIEEYRCKNDWTKWKEAI